MLNNFQVIVGGVGEVGSGYGDISILLVVMKAVLQETDVAWKMKLTPSTACVFFKFYNIFFSQN